MVKKMKLPFLFMKSTETTPPSWPWPICTGTLKTLSFRASTPQKDHVLNTIQDSSSSSPSPSPPPSEEEQETMLLFELGDQDSMEKVVVRGLKSERLFFEPGESCSSAILDPPPPATAVSAAADEDDYDNNHNGLLMGRFKESVVMAVLDSTDPFVDFRRSMQEMVEAHQGILNIKDWDCLEELLTCYLRVNGKSNHGYIVGAFVDLLVTLALSSSPSSSSSSDLHDHHHHHEYSYCSSSSCSSSNSTTNYSFTSPLSFSSSNYSTNFSTTTTPTISPSLSILEVDDEIQKPIDTVNNISFSSSSSSLSLSCSN